MKYRQKLLALVALAALGFAAVQYVQADEPRGYGPGYGPGMMGGYGSGGYGPGYGPGMMGGYGAGGYGPGSYGPGMMGNYGAGRGYGSGMMGYAGPLHALDLNDQQREKINQIQDEVRRKNWNVMGKLMDEQAHMRDLFLADKRDPAAIGKQAAKIADLRRQMLEASVDAHNRMEAVLTKEQRGQLRSSLRRGWMMGNE